MQLPPEFSELLKLFRKTKLRTDSFGQHEFKNFKIKRYVPSVYSMYTLNVNDRRAWANFPLGHKASDLFYEKTGLQTALSSSGKSKTISVEVSSKNFKKLKEWFDLIGDKVIMDDLLSHSICLSQNYVRDGDFKEATEIGLLEKKAKEQKCIESIHKIAEEMALLIKSMPYYSDADYICPVPRSSDSEDMSLPEMLCKNLSESLEMSSLLNKVCWKNKHCHLQDVNKEDRWQTLEDSDFFINPKAGIKGKVILLIDDMYQSGTTLHFVAHKLIEAGAKAVLGLTAVKALSDQDNNFNGKV